MTTNTTVLTDAEIARTANMLPIHEVAASLGFPEEVVEPYGRFKAKLHLDRIAAHTQGNKTKTKGKLILITAVNPTPAGEGKTTVMIGLADALKQRDKKVVVAMREPSLGPVFGMKGGAAGGGYSQVVPMEDLNLHFTGDLHAISAANNLLAALIDNSIFQGNPLGIDPAKVTWRRTLDMNDRQLRHCVTGLGSDTDGIARKDGFDITVASEVMAVFCLAKDLTELKKRLGDIVIGYRYDDSPVYARDLHAEGAMATLLKDAIHPNLVQTLEQTPVLVHGGPFANIAHGCNSLIATKLGLEVADYTVTEAGFGADLGAEKFCDIACRVGDMKPDAAVLVATIRALKYNGGQKRKDLAEENLDALKKGTENLFKHVSNLRNHFHLPVVVAINHFKTDTDAEIEELLQLAAAQDVPIHLVDVWAKGGAGALTLADEVLQLVEQPNEFEFLYDETSSIEEKILKIATSIYGAKKVSYSREAKRSLKRFTQLGFGSLAVCMAKTQYSLSDDKTLLGCPKDFILHIQEITLSNGAGFVVPLCGDIIKMPGLPKVPSASSIDIDENGTVTGLF